MPETRGPKGAFGQPAARRRATEQALVLVPARQKLEADALVPAEQRKKPVRGGRGRDLEASLILERPEGPDEIAVTAVQQPAQRGQAMTPVFHQRQQRGVV